MRTSTPLLALALCCVLAIPAAFARDTGKLLPLDPVREQQAQILAGAKASTGIYANLSASERDQLISRQAKMLRMIEGKKMSAELSEAQKLELFNTLEWIEATVNRADDERLVCERVVVVGSNLRQRVCMTVVQRREAREASKRQLELQNDASRRF
ncbi:MAG: hypothetical protein H0W24_12205 [Lysobacter sp.]|nr:hypothetical protein [Lysobacter sp.]